MENWGPSGWWGGGLAETVFWGKGVSRKGGDGRGVPMQMTVPALCAVTESPCRTPGWLMARWTALERAMSKGSAMLTWPTMPFSKKVNGRTWCVSSGQPDGPFVAFAFPFASPPLPPRSTTTTPPPHQGNNSPPSSNPPPRSPPRSPSASPPPSDSPPR